MQIAQKISYKTVCFNMTIYTKILKTIYMSIFMKKNKTIQQNNTDGYF